MRHTDTETHSEAHRGADYRVQLKQLGDPMERLRQVGPCPSLADLKARRSVKFAFSIHPIDSELQAEPCGIHFRLIFDYDVPLWRQEYRQPAYIPTARRPGSSVQTLRSQVSSLKSQI